MTTPPYTAGLHRIAADTYAYLRPPGSWGLSNCGLVVGGDDAVLVDTQFDLPSTRTLLAAVGRQVQSAVVKTVINTHANGDHCWGNELLPDAVIIGSAASAHEMEHEVTPAALAVLAGPSAPDPTVGAYIRRHFGGFAFSGITITPPTRTFSGRMEVTAGSRTLELIEVGPAHTEGDVIVHVPDEGVVFAGDILFVGDHPVVWTGPIDNWVRACDRIVDMDARLVVPGHGAVTDVAGVLLFRRYLEFVAQWAAQSFEAGVPYWEAASKAVLPEPFASWGYRERLVISLAAQYRHLGLAEATPLMQVLHHVAVMANTATIGERHSR